MKSGFDLVVQCENVHILVEDNNSPHKQIVKEMG